MNEAVHHFERAPQLNPNLAGPEYLLGDALVTQGTLTEALPHFQQALNLATTQGNAELVKAFQERLRSFPSGSPPSQTP